MAIFKFFYGVFEIILFCVVFVLAFIIALPVALVLWRIKRQGKYVHYFEMVLHAIVHLFFPTFGH